MLEFFKNTIDDDGNGLKLTIEETEMTDKKQFISNWLKDNPNDNEFDALDAWKNEVKFINQFNDWDNQLNWEDD